MTRLIHSWRRAFWLIPFAFGLSAHADVVRIVIDGTINPVSAEYIERGLARAADQHAQALLMEIQTPGGLSDSTRQIIAKMLASPVPVIVYVYPSGSRSASAGFYILEAADIAAMAPGTNTGAAHPVLMGITMDPVMKEKLENDSAAFIRSYAGKRGRNVEIAESAVRQSKSFTDQEALQQHLIDYVAKDASELLKDIDSKTITRFDGKTLLLHTSGAHIVDYEMSLILDGPEYLLPDPDDRLGRDLRRTESSRSNHSRSCRHHFRSPGGLRTQPATFAFRRGGSHFDSVHPVRLRGEVRHPWRSRHRWDCGDDPGSVTAGRRTNSTNADSASHGDRSQHHFRPSYNLPAEHRCPGPQRQGRDRRERADRRVRDGANDASA